MISGFVEHLEYFGGGGGFAESGKDPFDAVVVSLGVDVGHRVGGEDHVISVLMGRACGGFDTQAGRDTGQ